MKVLFVIPPQKTLLGDRTSVVGDPHLGIGYLAEMLRKHNITVTAVDMRLDPTINSLLETIERLNPDIIGITCYSFDHKTAYYIISRIKTQGNRLVVIGGPHVSAIRGNVLKETIADFAVKGEGEYTFLELCMAIEKGNKDFKQILGLIWRKENEIIENPDRPFIKDLDALPFPTYKEVDLKRYYSSSHTKGMQILTSRGCPYGCNFCSVRLTMGRNFRSRSPENVVDEIEYWYQRGYTSFGFVDDCFTLDGKRAEAICDLIIARKLKIRWTLYNGIRVDLVNRKLLKKMMAAGCVYVAFGVESGNNEILKTIGKGITVEQAKEAIKLASELGLKTGAFFIIGHPGETYKKAMETIKLAEKLPASYVNFFNLVPYPGTDLFEWVEEHGTFLQPPEVYLNNIQNKLEDPVFETKEFPAEERRKAIREGFSLYRKTQLKLSLGPILGYAIYVITSPRFIERIFWRLALGTKLGFIIAEYTNKFRLIRAERSLTKQVVNHVQ